MLLALSSPSRAGHGLINSFADVEWLPAPGTTPDSPAWAADRAAEAIALRFATDDAARLAALRTQCRERLAEATAMVRADRRTMARRAGDAYATLLERMAALLHDETALRRHAEELLAQQYLLTTEYLDLPRAARPVLLDLVATAAAHYDALAGRLPQRIRDALFFKEEEVRWSREMAVAADEQGL